MESVKKPTELTRNLLMFLVFNWKEMHFTNFAKVPCLGIIYIFKNCS